MKRTDGTGAARFRERGATLITSIAFLAIVALLLGAVGTIATSHFSRTQTETDYASAVHLAEAGINFELRNISLDTSDPSRPHQIDNPYTGSVLGVEGTFTVWVTNTDGSGPWAAPADMIMHSVGNVGGVERYVTIRGTKKGIFDEYAIFSVYYGPNRGLTFNGTNSTINGNVGSNSPVDPNSPNHVNGDITLAGTYANGSTSGPTVYEEPFYQPWPTVDEIANATFSGGLAWLKNNHNNGGIRTYATNNSNNLDSTISAGFPTSGSNQYKLQTNNFNSANTNTVGEKTLIFPPGDYYFEDIQVAGNNNAVMIDNRNGIVRIWVNAAPSGNTNDDTINANFYYADPTPGKFRLYYNKCNTLTLAGNTTFYGGFYAWREGCGANRLPSLNFTGGSTIFGSVIAGTVTVGGGTVVNFPNEGGNFHADDFSLWFGFKDSWREMPINQTGGVFAGGTTK